MAHTKPAARTGHAPAGYSPTATKGNGEDEDFGRGFDTTAGACPVSKTDSRPRDQKTWNCWDGTTHAAKSAGHDIRAKRSS
jgi:hypothetical protein